jgi:hypothetical protein
MREIESLIEFWQLQIDAAREKRKTETWMDATGMALGPDMEFPPKHFSTQTDSAIGAYLQWKSELEKFRDLFDSFRKEINEYLTEEAIAAAERFYLESVSHHTGWGIRHEDWLITIQKGSPWVGIQFELIRHRSVDLKLGTNKDGKFWIQYREYKNLNDTLWHFNYKNLPPIEVANHIVRRVIQHENNYANRGLGKKYPLYFRKYYSAQRSYPGKYNPWGTMKKNENINSL